MEVSSMRSLQRALRAGGVVGLLAGCASAAPPSAAKPDAAIDNPVEPTGGTPGSVAGVGGGLPPGRCAQGIANTSRVTPRVVLVLDGSCSMSTDYPANGKASATTCKANPNGRWAALRSALVDPTSGVVTKLQSMVEFGVAVFGSQPTCPLPADPVKPALNNLATISAKLPDVQPGMYTPTGPALDWVYDNLITPNQADGYNSPQIVILATDGEPNSCGGRGQAVTTNYQPSIDAVTKGTAKGVTTYVFSLADSSGMFHDHLQALANLGNPAANGNATLYEPSSPAQLEAALQQLVGAAIGCDLALNGEVTPGSECSGTVTVNGKLAGCNQPDGWKLIDAHHIQLQGKACDALKASSALVDARFPCEVFSPD
jgi:uncharacterized membrane protein